MIWNFITQYRRQSFSCTHTNNARLNDEAGANYLKQQIRRLMFLRDVTMKIAAQYEECTAVEIGAYPGTFGQLLKDTNIKLDAFDIVAESIPRINRSYYRTIVDADLEHNITIPLKLYDLVLSFAVIEHLVSDPLKYLENCWNLLSPGGHLIIQTPNKSYIVHRLKALLGKTTDESPLYAFLSKKREGFYGHILLYNPIELHLMLDHVGFFAEKTILFNSYKNPNVLKNCLIQLCGLIPSWRNQFLIIARKN